MMFNVHEFTYLARIEELQDRSIGGEGRYAVSQWLESVYYRRLDDATIETIAGIILQEYPQLSGAATKRHRFTTDKKTELLKTVFNRAFKKAADEGQIEQLVAQAEVTSSTKIYFPKWKKFVRIQLPRALGALFGDRDFVTMVAKIANTSTWLITAVGLGRAQVLINRVITPFVLKHAPKVAIKACSVMGVVQKVYCLFLIGVAGCCLVKFAAKRWNIVCVRRIFQGSKLTSLFQRLPKPIYPWFCPLLSGAQAAIATLLASPKISAYLKEMAENAERDQEVQVRVKACEVWMNIMKNRPEVVAA